MSISDKEKAMRDLLAIRTTMDKVSGAALFRDFIYSMGSMLIVFGVLLILTIGATWYINVSEIPQGKRIIAGLWIILTIGGGSFKMWMFSQRGKVHGMKFNEYLRKVLNKTFFGIDVPLEIALFIIIIYFVKNGEYLMVLPSIALGTGMLFGNLGYVFAEKRLVLFGYLFLAIAAWGFLSCSVNYYIYSIFAFGVMFVIWGLVLHSQSRQLEIEQAQEKAHEED